MEKPHMSRLFLTLAAACLFALPTMADDSAKKDGLCQGDSIGAFYVTKVAGAEDDGVEVGEPLCYRCRYGSRPMVMVFTRATGEPVGKLVKELDAVVGANKDSQLKGLVTLIGGESSDLTDQAKAMAGKIGSKNIPIVVAKDNKAGPKGYKLSADSEVTVVIANESQVIASHNFAADKIDVAAVIKEVKNMLN